MLTTNYGWGRINHYEDKGSRLAGFNRLQKESDMKKSSGRKSSVSKARTYAAMGDFWDTHDLSDFWDETKSARASVHLESEESFYGIEKGLSQTIFRAAKERGVSPHTLINLWLQEKVQKLKLSSGRG